MRLLNRSDSRSRFGSLARLLAVLVAGIGGAYGAYTLTTRTSQADLAEDQQAEIQALRKAQSEQKRTILEVARSEGVDRAEIQKRLEPLEAAFDTGLKAILTPEQLTQLEEAKAASKDRAKPHGRKGRKGPRRGPKQPADPPSDAL